MEYRELSPIAELRADVACVWFDDRRHREQLVLPDGCIDIVCSIGAPPVVAGPATLPITAQLEQQPLLGLRFKPGRAPSFLSGVPADALLNADVPLRELWHDDAERLADDLECAPTIAEGLMRLQRAALAQRVAQPDALVQAAVAELSEAPHLQVAELGDTLGISERQLLRRFTSAVGYGPKVLARVLRFQHFLRLMRAPAASQWDLARLAAEAGYADHAHLTRECTQLAGAVPSALRAA